MVFYVYFYLLPFHNHEEDQS